MSGLHPANEYETAVNTLRLLGNNTIEELEERISELNDELSEASKKLHTSEERVDELETQLHDLVRAVESAYSRIP